mgnify:CR=1 FL=1
MRNHNEMLRRVSDSLREIAETLDPIYRELEAWGPLYEQKQAMLALRSPGEERSAAYAELAELALSQLEDVPSALMWYGEGFKELPEADECRVQLHALALEHGYAEALVQLYAEARERVTDTDRLVSIATWIAVVYIDQLEAWEAAEGELLYARQLDEDRFETFELLDRVVLQKERLWDVLEHAD